MVQALTGGALMSIGTSLNLYAYGRLTSPSSIFNSLIKFDQSSGFYWKFSFFVGMICCPSILSWIYGNSVTTLNGTSVVFYDSNSSAIASLGVIGWCLAGLLIGYGSRMAGGCTISNVICGLPRLSRRSIVAVCVIGGSAVATATLRNKYSFLNDGIDVNTNLYNLWRLITHILFLVCCFFFFYILALNLRSSLFKEYLISFISGTIFGAGLLFSGMCRISKILGFLTINSSWDPTIAFAFASAAAMNFITF